MLTNPSFIIISSNRCSKILTRTLNLNPLHGKYKVSKDPIKKFRLKKVSMSEESNNKSNTVGTPSTSGSSNWDYGYNAGSNVLNQSTESRLDVHNYNLMIMNHFLSQGVTRNVNGLNYCPANMNYFPEMAMPECFTRRYYHSNENQDKRGPERRRNMDRFRDKELLTKRVWENSNKKVFNKPGFIFTLMSYNVLAQDLIFQHPHLYQSHDPAFLDWNTRWKNLFNEIRRFSPDILCLQEVQESHIKNYFSLLETLGYRSLYKRRTGIRTEGCAVYYKTDIVNLVEYTTVEFYQPNITILNRDNVAIIAKFAPKLHPTREFVVATTHLLYNPKRHDIRVAQMQVLLSEIERISYCDKTKSSDSYLPMIITGDLNSTPDSAIFEFLTKGTLTYEELSPKLLTKGSNMFTGKVLVPPDLRITDNCQHADLVKVRMEKEKTSRKDELALIELFNSEKRIEKKQKSVEYDPKLFCTGTLCHKFAIKSVYDHDASNVREGTTFQNEWVTVDYIFYSGKKGEYGFEEDKLKLISRYRLPTKDELTGITIPNSVLGSDHLSILAKFKLEF